MSRPKLFHRLQVFAERNGLVIGEPLGHGVHGSVFAAEYQIESGFSAIKAHEQQTFYCRERDAYLRLQEHRITTIRGCSVPELIRYDDELWVLEMRVVSRPFVLDFGGAYLDTAPEFSEEVMADWRAEKQEQFGPDWGEVQAILRVLEGYGIIMLDVNPGNISFRD